MEGDEIMMIAAQLKRTLLDLGYTEVQAMNLLQEKGVISDNCVTIEDIANADVTKAAEYLEGRLL